MLQFDRISLGCDLVTASLMMMLQVKPMPLSVIMRQHCRLYQITYPIHHFHIHLVQAITLNKMKFVLSQVHMLQQVSRLVAFRYASMFSLA